MEKSEAAVISWRATCLQISLVKTVLERKVKYSQLSLRRTPSGPASAVRLREVSGLQRVDVT